MCDCAATRVISRIEQLSVTTSGLDMGLSRDIADAGPQGRPHPGPYRLRWYAQSCSFIHEELGAEALPGAKMHLQDLLVERAAAVSCREKFDASEVRTLYRNAAPIIRVLILGLTQGDPSLQTDPQ